MKSTILSVLMLLLVISHVSAQGTYMEFKLTSDKGEMSGTTKVYERNGDVRSEMHIVDARMPAGFDRVTLVLKDSVKKAFNLDDKAKTYTVIDMVASRMREDAPSDYEVAVVGKEAVNGYNCTHVKIKSKLPGDDMDMWVSPDVLHYKQLTAVNSQYTKQGLMKALAEKGAAGMPVRVRKTEHGTGIQVDLVKSEVRSNAPTLFSLAEYKRSDTGSSTNGDAQEMIKKIQNMTPEERQQFIEEMRKKQQESQQH